MKIPFEKNTYLKKIEVNDDGLDLEFAPKKKIALMFICLNDRYWPYIGQVIKDCRLNFLPQHKVDYFVWTDITKENCKKQLDALETLFSQCIAQEGEKKQQSINELIGVFANIFRLYEGFYPTQLQDELNKLAANQIYFKREGMKFWIEAMRQITDADIKLFYESMRRILQFSQDDLHTSLEGTNLIETEAMEWPIPTLMRYHLFLNEEEKLKDYDYVFYLDADMRVVAKISDEILGEGITAAEHPMYSLKKEYIPPYEPNPESAAYINRPGKVVDMDGKPRFKPYYYAGGFQGGVAKEFLAAMHVMKENIDKDFNKNYMAIWNDESHWNKFLFEYKGSTIVLSPSYIYPDSLIKEYYEKIWGCSYEPKIITLTKPFSLSAQGAEEINKFTQQ